MEASLLARCTGAPLPFALKFAEQLSAAMALYAIDTPIRHAMFLANVGHESGGLRYTTELWGPTAAQRGYEGRRDLGNVKAGDGARFIGHGLIQTTGRANHAAVRDLLRELFPDTPDFEAEPTRLAETRWACLSAANYIDMRGLNGWADKVDFDGYCDLINRGRKTVTIGDSNGWAERVKLYAAGRKALGIDK